MTQVFAGVDLGGTSIHAALADSSGAIVVDRSVPTESHEGPNGVLNRIGSLLDELAKDVDGTIVSVGMGVPGLVDLASGSTKFLPNLPTQWRDVPVSQILGDALGCPVKILNDVRTATLGELRFGHGRGSIDLTMAYFSIGTGIGGGVVIDGKLRMGPLGAAGELGHQTILPDGPLCGCGNRGCLETLASGPAITAEGIRLMKSGLAPNLHELVKGKPGLVTPREMLAVSGQDAPVHDALICAARYLGIAAANVVVILHPELIVLGGGVAELGDILTDTVKTTIVERVGMFPVDDIRVERSRLGDRAGVVGAIALAMS